MFWDKLEVQMKQFFLSILSLNSMKSKITSSVKSVHFSDGFGRVPLPPCCQKTWQGKMPVGLSQL